MSEVGFFNEEQADVLHQNTVISVMSGLAIRYHTHFQRVADTWARLGQVQGDELAEVYAKRSEQFRAALIAEVPLVFSLQPSNMAVSVMVNKINPHTGELIDGSDYQVGLVSGLTGHDQPSKPFTAEDLKLAVERLKEQKQAGLVYGLTSGSVFLENY